MKDFIKIIDTDGDKVYLNINQIHAVYSTVVNDKEYTKILFNDHHFFTTIPLEDVIEMINDPQKEKIDNSTSIAIKEDENQLKSKKVIKNPEDLFL